MSLHTLKKPYLLLIGDTSNPLSAKTAFGLRDWVPEACVGQLRFSTAAVDVGLPDLSIREAAARGAKTLLIGIAPAGGQLPQSWHHCLLEALEAGLDLAAGLHQRLALIPAIAQCAKELGREIHDVRYSDAQFAVGTGLKRTGLRLLTVGTDCALGKKYTALAIAKELRQRGRPVDFRATGQTGVMISGRGLAIDAVIADFIAGAAEALSPANAPDHWDIVEGQGSLFHPAYAGVSLGLLHGSQPDALVLCHDPLRKALHGFPHMAPPTLEVAMPAYLAAARLTNPAVRFVGISLNTAALTETEARHMLEQTSRVHDLPCVDPIRTGAAAIVDHLESLE